MEESGNYLTGCFQSLSQAAGTMSLSEEELHPDKIALWSEDR